MVSLRDALMAQARGRAAAGASGQAENPGGTTSYKYSYRPPTPQPERAGNDVVNVNDLSGDNFFDVLTGQGGTDYTDMDENSGVAKTIKASFLGNVLFDEARVMTENKMGSHHYAGQAAQRGLDPYLYAPSGLNVYNDPNAPWYDPDLEEGMGVGFNRGVGRSEESPASDVYRFYQMGPGGPNSRRAHLQKLLYNAGLVQRDNPVPLGDWGDPFDEDYREAWELAVMEAQRTGVPLMTLLEDRAGFLEEQGGPGGGSGGRGGGGGAGPRRPTAQIISEEDARSIVDQVTNEQLGRKLTDDEEALAMSIVEAVRSQMLDETNALIDQQMAGGGSASQATDPRVSTTREVEERAAGEAGAYDVARAFANLIGISRGGTA